MARAITPFLAGTSHIPLRRFLAFDIPGAGAWAACFLAVGYIVAESASRAAALSHTIAHPIGTRRRRRRARDRRRPALPHRTAGLAHALRRALAALAC